MFLEPQKDRGEGVSLQATCDLSFEPYLRGLESFFEQLRGSATFPNVLLPTGCSSPLKNAVVTVQPEDVVSSYAQLFGRLPGSVVVLPESLRDFVNLGLLEEYFEHWFSPVYGYCPKVIVLPDEELYRFLEQGQIHCKGRSLKLICYYPFNSQNFLLGDKSILRRCLESSPVEGCAKLLVPGEICAKGDLQQTLEKVLRYCSKLVVQAPSGAGGFGTWIIETSNKEGYTVNDKQYDSLHAIIEEIQAQADSSEFIVMEFIEHTPVSMGAVLKEDGYYTLGPVRRQLVDGASYKGVFFESTQPQGFENVRKALESFLKDHCDKLPDRQNLPVIIGFDLLLTPEELLITECNTRQTGALPLEMLLALLSVDGESLYSKLTSGHLSAFELDHCKVPEEWASNLGLFEMEFPKTLSARFGLNVIFLPAEIGEDGVEVVLKKAFQTSNTILVAPATPPNLTGKIALQFVGPPEVLQAFFDELTNKGRTLEVKF